MLRVSPVLVPAPLRLGDRRGLLRLVGAVGLANATWLMVAIVVVGSLQPRHMADFHVMRDAAREILEGRSGGFVSRESRQAMWLSEWGSIRFVRG